MTVFYQFLRLTLILMQSIGAAYSKILMAFSISQKWMDFKYKYWNWISINWSNNLLPFDCIVSFVLLTHKVESISKCWLQLLICPWKPIVIHSSNLKFHRKNHVHHHHIWWVCKFVAKIALKKLPYPNGHCLNKMSIYVKKLLSPMYAQLQKKRKENGSTDKSNWTEFKSVKVIMT